MTKIIALDIGNTNITLGVFNDSEIVFRDRLISEVNGTLAHYKKQLEPLQKFCAYETSEVKVILCSVVPNLSSIFDEVVQGLFHVIPIHVGPSNCAGVELNIPNPSSLGPDRIANVVAAARIYSKPALVIDFGTATTFDVVGLSGAFEGGIIAVGPKTAMSSLVSNTARLSEIELVWPSQVLGKTTETAMQSGLVFGYMAMIDGLIESLKKERGELGKIIATGGLGNLFTQHSKYIDLYNPDLTILGLQLIAQGVR